MRAATYRGRCVDHARDRERTTDRKGKGKYGTKLWRHRREQQLSREPLCARCGKVAEIAHHLIGIENDPYHRRLQSLCTSCHSALHRNARGGTSESRPARGAAPPLTPDQRRSEAINRFRE